MSTKHNATIKEQHKIAKHNKELVRRFYREAFNNDNLAIINEIFAFTHVSYDSDKPAEPPKTGVEHIKQSIKTMRTIVTDLNLKIEDMIAEGDKVAVRFTFTIGGPLKGTQAGIPLTDRQIIVTGITIHRIDNNKIVESWGYQEAINRLEHQSIPEIA